jgi:hypothetical protein
VLQSVRLRVISPRLPKAGIRIETYQRSLLLEPRAEVNTFENSATYLPICLVSSWTVLKRATFPTVHGTPNGTTLR